MILFDNFFWYRRLYRWKSQNFWFSFFVGHKLASEVSEHNFGHLLLDYGLRGLRPSGLNLLERWLIPMFDHRNGVTCDALGSHSGCALFVAIHGLADRDAIWDALLELLASFANISCNCEFQHAEVFDTQSFLEVTLRIDRNQFIFFIDVVKLDGPDFLETATEGVSGLKRKGLVVAGHAHAFGFPLETDFDTLFGGHSFSWWWFWTLISALEIDYNFWLNSSLNSTNLLPRLNI